MCSRLTSMDRSPEEVRRVCSRICSNSACKPSSATRPAASSEITTGTVDASGMAHPLSLEGIIPLNIGPGETEFSLFTVSIQRLHELAHPRPVVVPGACRHQVAANDDF